MKILELIKDNSNFFIAKKDNTLFGVKIMDILDCCSTSDFHSLLHYDRDVEGFQISTEYRLSDVNVLQALPSIGLSISPIQVVHTTLIWIAKYNEY